MSATSTLLQLLRKNAAESENEGSPLLQAGATGLGAGLGLGAKGPANLAESVVRNRTLPLGGPIDLKDKAEVKHWANNRRVQNEPTARAIARGGARAATGTAGAALGFLLGGISGEGYAALGNRAGKDSSQPAISDEEKAGMKNPSMAEKYVAKLKGGDAVATAATGAAALLAGVITYNLLKKKNKK